MQRYYPDRETSGPEFDNKLIQLVRANPAIYDVSHPHYRRNPVRVAIWDRIATQLGAPSRFLQTKWKNIRYNYLQEVKCQETGTTNPNIRKRRFTEDLTFLQYTAQTYNVKKAQMYKTTLNNGSDNDSNSVMYPDTDFNKSDPYEVIEIEHSDDGSRQDYTNDNSMYYDNYDYDDKDHLSSIAVETQLKETADGDSQFEADADAYEDSQKAAKTKQALQKDADISETINNHNSMTPTQSPERTVLSPLLTPMIVMGNGKDDHKRTNGEITIEALPSGNKQTNIQRGTMQRNKRYTPAEILANMNKRKSEPAPFPCLTPINDPIEMYCLSLVDSLRNMPRSERERVKYEFANILKDAKYKDQS